MTRVKTEKISIDASCETIINPPSPLVGRDATREDAFARARALDANSDPLRRRV